jgi:hypothetical protein
MQLKKKLEKEAISQKSRKENMGLLVYDNEETDDTEIFVRGSYAYVSTDTFAGLTDRAIVMVSRIMIELKNNNTLWQFDQRKNERDSKVITELRKKEILFKTDLAYIHYVNPFLIRKGKIGNTIFQMIRLLENTSKVTTDHIKKLPWRGKIVISGKHYIEID